MRPLDHVWGESPAADRVWAQVCGMRPDLAGQRLFVVLQAYMDESYDQGGTFVLAGYISTAERWAEFSKEWEAALPNATKAKNGNYRFKMSEMARTRGGMSNVSIFHDIIQRHAIMGVSFTLDEGELKRAIDRISIEFVTIEWQEPLTPYYVAFRLFMELFHNYRTENPDALEIRGPVDFYFDDRQQDKKIIWSAWDEYIEKRPDDYKPMYGSPPKFENDEVFLPLQAADFQAWWTRKWVKEYGVHHIRSGEYTGFTRSDKNIYHLRIAVTEDSLATIIKGWIEQNFDIDPNLIRDSKIEERSDPPFPIEIAWGKLRSMFAAIFRRRDV